MCVPRGERGALSPLPPPLPPPLGTHIYLSYSLFYNSTSIHALPTLIASLYNASLSRATGGTQSIAAAAHALPRVSVEVAQRSAFTSLFGAILILIPLAFAAASYVTPHVRERETLTPTLTLTLALTLTPNPSPNPNSKP